MFDNETGEPTAQGDMFFIREAAETKTALSDVTAWWMCDSKSRPTLGGVSKYGSNWDLKGNREGVSMDANKLDPEDVTSALYRSCQSLVNELTRREMEATREQWRKARTADFFAQYTLGDGESLQDMIKAFSKWEAERPEPEA